MVFHVFEIIRATHKSLCLNNSGYKENRVLFKKLLLFDILPFLIAIVIWFLGNSILFNSDLASYLLTTYSIFSALLFSLIIVIVDKAKKLKETLLTETEENQQYLNRYLLFSKNIITLISFTIIVSLFLIFLLLLGKIEITGLKTLFGSSLNFDTFFDVHSAILSLLVYYFSSQFFILVLLIVSGMYDVFLEEIERRTNSKK